MIKPPRPQDLSNVATWDHSQILACASHSLPLEEKSIKEMKGEIETARREYGSFSQGFLILNAEMGKLIKRAESRAAFWRAVLNGENPKIPRLLKSYKVRGYTQNNLVFRRPKTIEAGRKDFNFWD